MRSPLGQNGFLIVDESPTRRRDTRSPQLTAEHVYNEETQHVHTTTKHIYDTTAPTTIINQPTIANPTTPDNTATPFTPTASDTTTPTSDTADAPNVFTVGKGDNPYHLTEEHFTDMLTAPKMIGNILVPYNGHISTTALELNFFPATETLAYKKVANRIKPVATTLPEKFRIVRRIPSDPLADLPTLPTQPPDFAPGLRYTEERMKAQNINPTGFLTAEEEKLIHHLIRTHEEGFAWTEEEKGKFSDDYFDPVVIPTIEHVPWILKNIPIPPGKYNEIIRIIKDKIASGVYEPSSSSYRSRWFCVYKKDGKSLRIVHDLQPLNAITIKDSGQPPNIELLAESFGGYSCYAVFDLFVGFDQRRLATESRDLTTFQTPLGTFRLTSIPMGYTNSMQIQHGDLTYILQDEIPHVTKPFVDDCPCKGPKTRYELPDGTFETIPENSGIRRFIWEHVQNINRVIQRVKHAGGTFSGKKSFFCVPEAIIVGHKCTYEGRLPDDSRIDKIKNWPVPESITEVRGFLGTLGTIRIYVKDYAEHARLLSELLRKDIEFEFIDRHIAAFENLKLIAINCHAIRGIDYESPNEVILAVDSSWYAVGYWLSQIGDDNKRYPNRYGSITFNEREQRYSQAKLELYGLFRALKASRIFIIGVKNLIVEVDAKYIKGMINNPDIQPNNTINRWIAGILLFDFKLRHVSAKRHMPADGLSRRRASDDDIPQDDSDPDDWIDEANAFCIEAANWTFKPRLTAACYATETDIPDTFARSEKQIARDADILRIEAYLKNPQRPPDMSADRFRQWLTKAKRFFIQGNRLWRRDDHRRHKLVISDDSKRLQIIREAHDDTGHKGIFATRARIRDRFWWSSLDYDVKWFVRTCHNCQIRTAQRLHIPPTVPEPGGLFRIVHMDTMKMPASGGFTYITQARCSLSAWPEYKMLRSENATAIAKFIFEDILCRHGAIEVIVTDNGTPYVAALDVLRHRYGINHIRISPYNSQANGIVERRHFDVRESLIKAADGKPEKWSQVAPSVFWAERITIHPSTGYSPYFIAHGTEPTLPLDISEATYLCPPITSELSTQDLLAHRARQLQKRPADLKQIHDKVYKSRLDAVRKLEQRFQHTIKNFHFKKGDLVLVRNNKVDMELDRKTKPRYLGPMVVIRKTQGGSYILAETDGTLSKLRYAAKRLIPYRPRSIISGERLSQLLNRSDEELYTMTHDSPDEASLADGKGDGFIEDAQTEVDDLPESDI